MERIFYIFIVNLTAKFELVTDNELRIHVYSDGECFVSNSADLNDLGQMKIDIIGIQNYDILINGEVLTLIKEKRKNQIDINVHEELETLVTNNILDWNTIGKQILIFDFKNDSKTIESFSIKSDFGIDLHRVNHTMTNLTVGDFLYKDILIQTKNSLYKILIHKIKPHEINLPEEIRTRITKRGNEQDMQLLNISENYWNIEVEIEKSNEITEIYLSLLNKSSNVGLLFTTGFVDKSIDAKENNKNLIVKHLGLISMSLDSVSIRIGFVKEVINIPLSIDII